jgi:hypothetical protein
MHGEMHSKQKEIIHLSKYLIVVNDFLCIKSVVIYQTMLYLTTILFIFEGHIQSRVVYFLMNIHVLPRTIYLTRVKF